MEATPTLTPRVSGSRASADRIADATRVARALAAERLRLVETLRIDFETEFGATWTAPDELAWRDLRAERHREVVTQRRVAIEAAPDGMAWFGALLSAEDALGASAAVSGIARGLMADGETRTRSQIEADVFRDLLTDGGGVVAPPRQGEAPVASPAARRRVRAEVLVHVPVLAAMGHSDAPGSLDGYGPIDADTARRLCAEAPGFVRVLTDPADGATLSFGRTTYRVPIELRRLLTMRDEVCRFVGCTRSAAYCDIDHTVP